MSIDSWVPAALCAGVLGWVGPHVIARLPASKDAGPETPGYRSISDVHWLSAWLSLAAIVLVTVVNFAVPARLLPAWVILCGAGIWLAYVDWRTQLLPTRIIVPVSVAVFAAVAVESWLASDWRILLRAVIASLIAFGVFWLFWWVGELWRAGGFGYGDVRFAAPLGLVLGSGSGWAVLVGLYIGIILGAIAGLVMKARGQGGSFALGPWLLLGAVLAPVVT